MLCARDRKLLEETAEKIGGAHVLSRSICASHRRPAGGGSRSGSLRRHRHRGEQRGSHEAGRFRNPHQENWMDGYALKMFGAVRLTRAAWPHLRERRARS